MGVFKVAPIFRHPWLIRISIRRSLATRLSEFPSLLQGQLLPISFHSGLLCSGRVANTSSPLKRTQTILFPKTTQRMLRPERLRCHERRWAMYCSHLSVLGFSFASAVL